MRFSDLKYGDKLKKNFREECGEKSYIEFCSQTKSKIIGRAVLIGDHGEEYMIDTFPKIWFKKLHSWRLIATPKPQSVV